MRQRATRPGIHGYRPLYFAALCMMPCLALSASLPVGAAAPARGTSALTSEPMAAANMLQLTFGLLVVLGLVFAVAWLLRRFNRWQVTADGQMKILGGLSVGTRERVLLIEVGETQLLVGVSPGRIQTLHVLDQPLATPASAPASSGFAERLQTALRQGKAS